MQADSHDFLKFNKMSTHHYKPFEKLCIQTIFIALGIWQHHNYITLHINLSESCQRIFSHMNFWENIRIVNQGKNFFLNLMWFATTHDGFYFTLIYPFCGFTALLIKSQHDISRIFIHLAPLKMLNINNLPDTSLKHLTWT